VEPSQTAKLLAKAQLVDNRTVDAMTVAAWHEIVGPLDFDDAMTALTEHRRASTDYLMPAHIVAGVKRIRAERHSVWNRPTGRPPWSWRRPSGWRPGLHAGRRRWLAG